jgi:hypothetical protein
VSERRSLPPFMAGFEAMYDALVRLELADPKTGEQKVVGDLADREEVQGLRFNFQAPNVTTAWLAK